MLRCYLYKQNENWHKIWRKVINIQYYMYQYIYVVLVILESLNFLICIEACLNNLSLELNNLSLELQKRKTLSPGFYLLISTSPISLIYNEKREERLWETEQISQIQRTMSALYITIQIHCYSFLLIVGARANIKWLWKK